MAEIEFTKMHGAGNDYVFIDLAAQSRPDNIEQMARQISDRHRGVGADGLILIGPSSTAVARMEMWNSDGSRAEMCGNGIRCVALHLLRSRVPEADSLDIETDRGILAVSVHRDENGQVRSLTVNMGAPILAADQIPVRLAGDPPLNVLLECEGRKWQVSCVSMGNPHCVVYVDSLTDELLNTWGPRLERHPLFPNRTNVEFVQRLSSDAVKARVWERGSGETQACGTGACAIAVVGSLTGRSGRDLAIELPGGVLRTRWDAAGPVFLTGPATHVFTGHWSPQCGLQ